MRKLITGWAVILAMALPFVVGYVLFGSAGVNAVGLGFVGLMFLFLFSMAAQAIGELIDLYLQENPR